MPREGGGLVQNAALSAPEAAQLLSLAGDHARVGQRHSLLEATEAGVGIQIHKGICAHGGRPALGDGVGERSQPHVLRAAWTESRAESAHGPAQVRFEVLVGGALARARVHVSPASRSNRLGSLCARASVRARKQSAGNVRGFLRALLHGDGGTAAFCKGQRGQRPRARLRGPAGGGLGDHTQHQGGQGGMRGADLGAPGV
mmetsp:Transcript_19020/g.36313  ORF Transcript_19020/g.36313 Transcript_19020/m.36313 type:complete len:201 (-) Transcript_19020:103-705(-)